jgi:hypothetical protein
VAGVAAKEDATMKESRKRVFAVVLALACAWLVPSMASAEESLFGVRFGYYAHSDHAFAGAEYLVPVAHRIEFNPNVEYVFADGLTYMTFNGDFHYDFPSRRRAFVWLGAGLGLVYVDPKGPSPSNTDVAANFIGGVGLSRGPVIPYFQFKLIAKGDTEAVFAFGLRF